MSSEEQIVVGDIPTQWSWDVVPLEAGAKTLVIIVTARVKLAGFSDEQKDLNVIERQIVVHIGPAHLVRGFIFDSRGWLFPSIIIPKPSLAFPVYHHSNLAGSRQPGTDNLFESQGDEIREG